MDSLTRYLPQTIVQHITFDAQFCSSLEWLPNHDATLTDLSGPITQEVEGAVLFADITGFTSITEYMNQCGGTDEGLANTLNQYFQLLIRIISQHQGIIMRFLGDAMLVIFVPDPENPQQAQMQKEDMSSLVRRAAECALGIKAELSGFRVQEKDTAREPISQSQQHDSFLSQDQLLMQSSRTTQPTQEIKLELDIKIGIGVGKMTVIHVDGGFSRMEYILTGQPLIQCFLAENMVKNPRGKPSVVASPEAWEYIYKYFNHAMQAPDPRWEKQQQSSTSTSISSTSSHSDTISLSSHLPHQKNFVFLESCHTTRRQEMKKGEKNLTLNLRPQHAYTDASKAMMKRYLPQSVIPWVESGQERFLNELREVTVLFVSTGLPEAQMVSQGSLTHLLVVRQVLMSVQSAVVFYGGEINKFMLDDKGSTVIAVFGLPPKAHENDALRGVFAALCIVCSLRQLRVSGEFLYPSIGITTGRAFCGGVGSMKRKEYTVLGDSVNLSARFMQKAKELQSQLSPSEKHTNVPIICDGTTAKLASSSLTFKPVDSILVKGKSQPIDAYRPFAVGLNRLYPTLGLSPDQLIRPSPTLLLSGFIMTLHPSHYHQTSTTLTLHSKSAQSSKSSGQNFFQPRNSVVGDGLVQVAPNAMNTSNNGPRPSAMHPGSSSPSFIGLPLGIQQNNTDFTFSLTQSRLHALTKDLHQLQLATQHNKFVVISRLLPTSPMLGAFQGVFSLAIQDSYSAFGGDSLTFSSPSSSSNQVTSNNTTVLAPSASTVTTTTSQPNLNQLNANSSSSNTTTTSQQTNTTTNPPHSTQNAHNTASHLRVSGSHSSHPSGNILVNSARDHSARDHSSSDSDSTTLHSMHSLHSTTHYQSNQLPNHTQSSHLIAANKVSAPQFHLPQQPFREVVLVFALGSSNYSKTNTQYLNAPNPTTPFPIQQSSDAEPVLSPVVPSSDYDLAVTDVSEHPVLLLPLSEANFSTSTSGDKLPTLQQLRPMTGRDNLSHSGHSVRSPTTSSSSNDAAGNTLRSNHTHVAQYGPKNSSVVEIHQMPDMGHKASYLATPLQYLTAFNFLRAIPFFLAKNKHHFEQIVAAASESDNDGWDANNDNNNDNDNDNDKDDDDDDFDDKIVNIDKKVKNVKNGKARATKEATGAIMSSKPAHSQPEHTTRNRKQTKDQNHSLLPSPGSRSRHGHAGSTQNQHLPKDGQFMSFENDTTDSDADDDEMAPLGAFGSPSKRKPAHFVYDDSKGLPRTDGSTLQQLVGGHYFSTSPCILSSTSSFTPQIPQPLNPLQANFPILQRVAIYLSPQIIQAINPRPYSLLNSPFIPIIPPQALMGQSPLVPRAKGTNGEYVHFSVDELIKFNVDNIGKLIALTAHYLNIPASSLGGGLVSSPTQPSLTAHNNSHGDSQPNNNNNNSLTGQQQQQQQQQQQGNPASRQNSRGDSHNPDLGQNRARSASGHHSGANIAQFQGHKISACAALSVASQPLSPIAHISCYATYTQFDNASLKRLAAVNQLAGLRYKSGIPTQPVELQHSVPIDALTPLLQLQNSRAALIASQPRGSNGSLSFLSNGLLSLQLDFSPGYQLSPTNKADADNFEQHHEQRYIAHARDRILNHILMFLHRPVIPAPTLQQQLAMAQQHYGSNHHQTTPDPKLSRHNIRKQLSSSTSKSSDSNLSNSAINSQQFNLTHDDSSGSLSNNTVVNHAFSPLFTPNCALSPQFSTDNDNQSMTGSSVSSRPLDVNFAIPHEMLFQDDTFSLDDSTTLHSPAIARKQRHNSIHNQKDQARRWATTNGSLDYIKNPLTHMMSHYMSSMAEVPRRNKGLVVLIEAAPGLGKSLLLHTLKNESITPVVQAAANALDSRPYSLIGSLVWQLLEQEVAVYETLFKSITTFYGPTGPTILHANETAPVDVANQQQFSGASNNANGRNGSESFNYHDSFHTDANNINPNAPLVSMFSPPRSQTGHMIHNSQTTAQNNVHNATNAGVTGMGSETPPTHTSSSYPDYISNASTDAYDRDPSIHPSSSSNQPPPLLQQSSLQSGIPPPPPSRSTQSSAKYPTFIPSTPSRTLPHDPSSVGRQRGDSRAIQQQMIPPPPAKSSQSIDLSHHAHSLNSSQSSNKPNPSTTVDSTSQRLLDYNAEQFPTTESTLQPLPTPSSQQSQYSSTLGGSNPFRPNSASLSNHSKHSTSHTATISINHHQNNLAHLQHLNSSLDSIPSNLVNQIATTTPSTPSCLLKHVPPSSLSKYEDITALNLIKNATAIRQLVLAARIKQNFVDEPQILVLPARAAKLFNRLLAETTPFSATSTLAPYLLNAGLNQHTKHGESNPHNVNHSQIHPHPQSSHSSINQSNIGTLDTNNATQNSAFPTFTPLSIPRPSLPPPLPLPFQNTPTSRSSTPKNPSNQTTPRTNQNLDNHSNHANFEPQYTFDPLNNGSPYINALNPLSLQKSIDSSRPESQEISHNSSSANTLHSCPPTPSGAFAPSLQPLTVSKQRDRTHHSYDTSPMRVTPALLTQIHSTHSNPSNQDSQLQLFHPLPHTNSQNHSNTSTNGRLSITTDDDTLFNLISPADNRKSTQLTGLPPNSFIIDAANIHVFIPLLNIILPELEFDQSAFSEAVNAQFNPIYIPEVGYPVPLETKTPHQQYTEAMMRLHHSTTSIGTNNQPKGTDLDDFTYFDYFNIVHELLKCLLFSYFRYWSVHTPVPANFDINTVKLQKQLHHNLAQIREHNNNNNTNNNIVNTANSTAIPPTLPIYTPFKPPSISRLNNSTNSPGIPHNSIHNSNPTPNPIHPPNTQGSNHSHSNRDANLALLQQHVEGIIKSDQNTLTTTARSSTYNDHDFLADRGFNAHLDIITTHFARLQDLSMTFSHSTSLEALPPPPTLVRAHIPTLPKDLHLHPDHKFNHKSSKSKISDKSTTSSTIQPHLASTDQNKQSRHHRTVSEVHGGSSMLQDGDFSASRVRLTPLPLRIFADNNSSDSTANPISARDILDSSQPQTQLGTTPTHGLTFMIDRACGLDEYSWLFLSALPSAVPNSVLIISSRHMDKYYPESMRNTLTTDYSPPPGYLQLATDPQTCRIKLGSRHQYTWQSLFAHVLLNMAIKQQMTGLEQFARVKDATGISNALTMGGPRPTPLDVNFDTNMHSLRGLPTSTAAGGPFSSPSSTHLQPSTSILSGMHQQSFSTLLPSQHAATSPSSTLAQIQALMAPRQVLISCPYTQKAADGAPYESIAMTVTAFDVNLGSQASFARSLPTPLLYFLSTLDGNPQLIRECPSLLKSLGYLRFTQQFTKLQFTSLLGNTDPSLAFPRVKLSLPIAPHIKALLAALCDRISPSQMLILKVATLLGHVFNFNLLLRAFPLFENNNPREFCLTYSGKTTKSAIVQKDFLALVKLGVIEAIPQNSARHLQLLQVQPYVQDSLYQDSVLALQGYSQTKLNRFFVETALNPGKFNPTGVSHPATSAVIAHGQNKSSSHQLVQITEAHVIAHQAKVQPYQMRKQPIEYLYRFRHGFFRDYLHQRTLTEHKVALENALQLANDEINYIDVENILPVTPLPITLKQTKLGIIATSQEDGRCAPVCFYAQDKLLTEREHVEIIQKQPAVAEFDLLVHSNPYGKIELHAPVSSLKHRILDQQYDELNATIPSLSQLSPELQARFLNVHNWKSRYFALHQHAITIWNSVYDLAAFIAHVVIQEFLIHQLQNHEKLYAIHNIDPSLRTNTIKAITTPLSISVNELLNFPRQNIITNGNTQESLEFDDLVVSLLQGAANHVIQNRNSSTDDSQSRPAAKSTSTCLSNPQPTKPACQQYAACESGLVDYSTLDIRDFRSLIDRFLLQPIAVIPLTNARVTNVDVVQLPSNWFLQSADDVSGSAQFQQAASLQDSALVSPQAILNLNAHDFSNQNNSLASVIEQTYDVDDASEEAITTTVITLSATTWAKNGNLFNHKSQIHFSIMFRPQDLFSVSSGDADQFLTLFEALKPRSTAFITAETSKTRFRDSVRNLIVQDRNSPSLDSKERQDIQGDFLHTIKNGTTSSVLLTTSCYCYKHEGGLLGSRWKERRMILFNNGLQFRYLDQPTKTPPAKPNLKEDAKSAKTKPSPITASPGVSQAPNALSDSKSVPATLDPYDKSLELKQDAFTIEIAQPSTNTAQLAKELAQPPLQVASLGVGVQISRPPDNKYKGKQHLLELSVEMWYKKGTVKWSPRVFVLAFNTAADRDRLESILKLLIFNNTIDWLTKKHLATITDCAKSFSYVLDISNSAASGQDKGRSNYFTMRGRTASMVITPTIGRGSVALPTPTSGGSNPLKHGEKFPPPLALAATSNSTINNRRISLANINMNNTNSNSSFGNSGFGGHNSLVNSASSNTNKFESISPQLEPIAVSTPPIQPTPMKLPTVSIHHYTELWATHTVSLQDVFGQHHNKADSAAESAQKADKTPKPDYNSNNKLPSIITPEFKPLMDCHGAVCSCPTNIRAQQRPSSKPSTSQQTSALNQSPSMDNLKNSSNNRLVTADGLIIEVIDPNWEEFVSEKDKHMPVRVGLLSTDSQTSDFSDDDSVSDLNSLSIESLCRPSPSDDGDYDMRSPVEHRDSFSMVSDVPAFKLPPAAATAAAATPAPPQPPPESLTVCNVCGHLSIHSILCPYYITILETYLEEQQERQFELEKRNDMMKRHSSLPPSTPRANQAGSNTPSAQTNPHSTPADDTDFRSNRSNTNNADNNSGNTLKEQAQAISRNRQARRSSQDQISSTKGFDAFKSKRFQSTNSDIEEHDEDEEESSTQDHNESYDHYFDEKSNHSHQHDDNEDTVTKKPRTITKRRRTKVALAHLHQKVVLQQRRKLQQEHHQRVRRNNLLARILNETATLVSHAQVLSDHLQTQVDILNSEMASKAQSAPVIGAIVEVEESAKILRQELHSVLTNIPTILDEHGLIGLLHYSDCKLRQEVQTLTLAKYKEKATFLSNLQNQLDEQHMQLETDLFSPQPQPLPTERQSSVSGSVNTKAAKSDRGRSKDARQYAQKGRSSSIMNRQRQSVSPVRANPACAKVTAPPPPPPPMPLAVTSPTPTTPLLLENVTNNIQQHRPRVPSRPPSSNRSESAASPASPTPAHTPNSNSKGSSSPAPAPTVVPAVQSAISPTPPAITPQEPPHSPPGQAGQPKREVSIMRAGGKKGSNAANSANQLSVSVSSIPQVSSTPPQPSNTSTTSATRENESDSIEVDAEHSLRPITPTTSQVSRASKQSRRTATTGRGGSKSRMYSQSDAISQSQPGVDTMTNVTTTTNANRGENRDGAQQQDGQGSNTNATTNSNAATTTTTTIKSFGAAGLEAPYQAWLLSQYTQELQQQPEELNPRLSNKDHDVSTQSDEVASAHTAPSDAGPTTTTHDVASSTNMSLTAQSVHKPDDTHGPNAIDTQTSGPGGHADVHHQQQLDSPLAHEDHHLIDASHLNHALDLLSGGETQSVSAGMNKPKKTLCDLILDPLSSISVSIPQDDMYFTVLEGTKCLIAEAHALWEADYDKYLKRELELLARHQPETLSASFSIPNDTSSNSQTTIGTTATPAVQLPKPESLPLWHHGIASPILTWAYNTFDEDPAILLLNIVRMLAAFDIPHQFQIDPTKLATFLCAVWHCYRDNPYHSVRHAMDVTLTVWSFLTLGQGSQLMNNLERFALIIASFCHDIDHPLINNAYCSTTRNAFAQISNDQAVLEYHHCRTTWTILQRPECNILSKLTRNEYAEFRKISLLAILATDMTQHFSMVERFNKLMTQLEDFRTNAPTHRALTSELYHSQQGFLTWLQGQKPTDLYAQKPLVPANSAAYSHQLVRQDSSSSSPNMKRPSSSTTPTQTQTTLSGQLNQRRLNIHIGPSITQPTASQSPWVNITGNDKQSPDHPSHAMHSSSSLTPSESANRRLTRRASVVLTPSRENCIIQVAVMGNDTNDNDDRSLDIYHDVQSSSSTLPIPIQQTQFTSQPRSADHSSVRFDKNTTIVNSSSGNNITGGALIPSPLIVQNTDAISNVPSHSHYLFSPQQIQNIQLNSSTHPIFTFYNSNLPLTNNLPLYAFVRRISFTDRVLIIQMLLHAADISNPTKPWRESKRWADTVCNEFGIQGDLEQYYGFPISPNCNRRETNLAMINVSFIDYVVAPLFFSLQKLLPDMSILCRRMSSNRNTWCALYTTFIDSTLARLNAIYSLKQLQEHYLYHSSSSSSSSSSQSSIPPPRPNIPFVTDSSTTTTITLTEEDNIHYGQTLFPFVAPPVPQQPSDETLRECFARLAHPCVLPHRDLIKDKAPYVYKSGETVVVAPSDQNNLTTATSQLVFALPGATVNVERDYWKQENQRWFLRKQTYDDKYNKDDAELLTSGDDRLIGLLQEDYDMFTFQLQTILDEHCDALENAAMNGPITSQIIQELVNQAQGSQYSGNCCDADVTTQHDQQQVSPPQFIPSSGQTLKLNTDSIVLATLDTNVQYDIPISPLSHSPRMAPSAIPTVLIAPEIQQSCQPLDITASQSQSQSQSQSRDRSFSRSKSHILNSTDSSINASATTTQPFVTDFTPTPDLNSNITPLTLPQSDFDSNNLTDSNTTTSELSDFDSTQIIDQLSVVNEQQPLKQPPSISQQSTIPTPKPSRSAKDSGKKPKPHEQTPSQPATPSSLSTSLSISPPTPCRSIQPNTEQADKKAKSADAKGSAKKKGKK